MNEISQEQKTMIADCLCQKRLHLLFDKELNFLDNLELEDFISEKQNKWLGNIWERVTENG